MKLWMPVVVYLWPAAKPYTASHWLVSESWKGKSAKALG